MFFIALSNCLNNLCCRTHGEKYSIALLDLSFAELTNSELIYLTHYLYNI